MITLWQDVKYAVRMLGRNPGFTLIAVLTLALGIGVNISQFSVAEAFLIHPYPFHNLNRLAVVLELRPHQTKDTNAASPANYDDWRKQAHSFEQFSGYRYDTVNLSTAGAPQVLEGFDVSTNFFDTIGIKPALGRAFLPQEGEPGQEQVVLLSDGVWRGQFGADPHIVGQTIHLDRKAFTVIGVMGSNAKLPQSAEVWMPLALQAKDWADRGTHELFVVARLREGSTIDQAQAEMRTISRRLSDAYPNTNRDWSARVMSLTLFAVGDYTRQYTLLSFGANIFVLLIACANVANLQLARVTSRQKEVALRMALGANRWRIVRQLLVESILLALAGASVGLLLASWDIHFILAYMPADVARYIGGWDQIRLDPAALAFAAAAAVVAGILAGIAPALQSSRADLNETLKEGGRGTSSGRGRHRVRNALVAAQVALALMLMVAAGLMVKGFRAVLATNENFQSQSALTMQLHLPDSPAYEDRHARAQFYDRALAQLAAIPGVQAAAAADGIPFGHYQKSMQFSIEGRPVLDAASARSALDIVTTSNYFETLHLPMLRGRGFTAGDGPDAPGVAIINQRLVNLFWPHEDPIGRRIKAGADDSQNPWLTIVGVVADVQYQWLDRIPEPVVYRPLEQAPPLWNYFVLRASGDVLHLTGAARGAIASVDPDQPISEIKTMDTVVHEDVIGLAYIAAILGGAGILALVLAGVGVYGVMAYLVGERVHEIGIRMALGASPGSVVAMVVRRGLLMTCIGIAIGLPGSYALASLLASLFYGVRATDAETFFGIPLLLATIAMVACYIPARRATRVDPMVALRYE
jgi:putative ABC transport system permease protein